MLIAMCLPKLDLYQGTDAPNCFKSYTNYWFPDFQKKKKNKFHARSEIHLAWRI